MVTTVKLPGKDFEVAVDGPFQLVRLDKGTGAQSSPINDQNPMPVAGTVALGPDAMAALAALIVAAATPAVQAITAQSLPLPAGAASDAGLEAILNKLSAVPATADAQATAKAVLDAILAKLPTGPATAAAQAAILAAIQAGAPMPASENHIGSVTGINAFPTASIIRPANTTAYPALSVINNAVATVLSFPNAARMNGGSAYVVGARLTCSQSTNTARSRLHLFSSAPAAITDGTVYPDLWANRATYVGYVDFDAMTTEGAGSTCAKTMNKAERLLYACATGSTTLYGILTTKDAIATPLSAGEWHIQLGVEYN